MKQSLSSLTLVVLLFPNLSAAETLKLQRGDHICLVGNALGERMQHHNYWETLLHQRFPDKELVVRNLCFPGDEPFERIRSQNFGDPDQHLAHSKASVVLYFFGFNESFAGKVGAADFAADMTRLVGETKKKNYSGKGAPRIVLVSPIACEKTGDPHLPDGKAHNERLATYTRALSEVAKATGVGFVDVFTPTRALFESSRDRLTLNGSHLNDAGYRALASILDDALFGAGGPSSLNSRLKVEVDNKNFHWWHRYRAVNGYSIYGARGKAGFDGTYRNRDVMERERAILDQMCANRDRRIWAIARGESVAAEVDDSRTLSFITPKTNVGGENDPNAKKGKLGSLDYLTAEEQRKLFQLAPGYEINLVASEERFPELANPVALNFDNKGRLWVATMPSYPHWKPKTPMDDKLLIFEDHDSDGRADECKVFAGGLHQPTGFEIGNGGAYIAQQPDILFVKDTDGDDKADTRVRKLIGFDSADSHHGIAAFEWGPGGGLYFQEGTFKYSQVESPYGLTRLHEAGIWRYEPRTEKLGVHVSMAFSNPWGHVFDRWGQNFIGDASPGNCYWAAPISGRIKYPDKHPGGTQHRRLAKATGGGPGYGQKYRFPTFYPKRTRPLGGCAMISSRHFPPDVQGNFLVTNCIGDRMVLNHQVREEGSGFVGKEVTPIVSCEDGNFRPVDVQIAPDGSLYIVDWHNALIGHLQHNLRDPKRDHSHGRIWRVTYKGRPLVKPAKIDGEPIPALLELLKVPEDRTRYRARRELAERETADVVGALGKWMAALVKSDEEYEHHRLEALWMFQTHNVVNEELLRELLAARDHRARAAATRVLSFWLDRVKAPLALLRGRINDPHPRVRLEAVRALSFLDGDGSSAKGRGDNAIEVALDVLNHDMDHYLQYTLDETMRQLEQ
ncbi:MAG: GDSL-type esterase/lipase family protein [Planctomycetota bacterium]|nr:GDSL-type esterase/lipase family protein [Planctomycetota bacterium]